MSRPHTPRSPLVMAAAAALACVASAWLATMPTAAQGQTTQPSQSQASPADTVLGTYKWRSIGPDRGGRSIAVSGVKGRPREAYFGAVGGGLWKTTDAGNNWAPVTDG